MALHTSLKNNSIYQNVAVRTISITMGFAFFAGGWRRFYNMPAKHDITSPAHLANKLVEAAPGSPIEGAIHWVLYHPWAAELTTYIMSTAEIAIGLCLMIGLLTRLAAVGGAIINICLMLIFGWMGFECLDEWTMAGLGFAICTTIMFTGSGTYSVDYALGKNWFAKYFTDSIKPLLVAISAIFTIGFYSYYFGIFTFKRITSVGEYSVVAKPVDGATDRYTLYVNGGGSSRPMFVKSITYALKDGSTLTTPATEIIVLRNHFKPWSQGGKLTDGVLAFTLGAKVDIERPVNAVSAVIDVIENKKDPDIKLP